jgi:hypothetical protein
MASRVCYVCDTKAHVTLVDKSGRQRPVAEGGVMISAAFVCDECGAMSIGQRRMPSLISDVGAYLNGQGRVETWLPVHGSGRAFPDVPDHISQAATEAFRCHSIGAFRAAGSLARAVIEATAKDKGVTMNGIASKIDAMAEQGLIRPHIQEAAHEVRHLGNDMAHGDFIEPVTLEESTLSLELMAEVLNEVFQSPARVAKARQAREARAAQNTSN